MTDIMKLADNCANACADVREFLGANAGMDEADGTWIASQQARAALQSAIEALQAENERLKSSLFTANRNNIRLVTAHLEQEEKTLAERDALQAKLDAIGKGEPVGFMSPQQLELIKDPEDESGHYIPLRKTAAGNFVMALYAAPKALAPLTDEQIDRAALEQVGFDGCGTQPMNTTDIRRIVRAAHGIGGTQ